MLANRMSSLDSSGIRRMFELAAKMKNPVNLSIGQPDFDVPAAITAAATRAIKDGKNKYTPTAGIPELRAAIEKELNKEGLSPESVAVVAGASGGLVLALLALADSSTDVFIPDPCFVTYGHMVRLAGARPISIDTYPDFRLTPALLEQAVTHQTTDTSAHSTTGERKRILMFNSPVNPTGLAYTGAEIKALALSARRLSMQVISDEVYDRFCYDFAHESWLKYDPGAILIRTFGKTWGMTGWRIGFAAGPRSLLDPMMMLQQFIYVCVNTPAQWSAIEALNTDMSKIIDTYRKKRDLVYDTLGQHFNLTRPQGAFYAFPEIPTSEFIQHCTERELLITPGAAFSNKNTHFRISFALDDDTLRHGLKLLIEISKGTAK